MRQARASYSWSRAAVALSAVLLGASCDSGDVMSPGSGDEPTITVSNASPRDGDGTLDPAATVIQHYVGHGVEQLDRVTISGYDTAHTVLHELEVLWVPATAEVRMVQHFWAPPEGETSGATRCAAGTPHVCPRGAIVADAATRTVTFNSVVLQDLFGGTATSTLTGSGVWEDGFSDGGDH